MIKEFEKKLSMKIATAVRHLYTITDVIDECVQLVLDLLRTWLYYVLTLILASPYILLIFVLAAIEYFIRIDYKRRSKNGLFTD